MILAPTKDGLIVAMVKLAVSTCNRDWGQNTLHCWSPGCKILIWKALIAKCATTLFSCCLQGEGSQEEGGASSPFWQLCWLQNALAKWSFIFVPGACICPFRSSSLWRPRKQIWWHNPQFLMKGLTFIHSIIDRSSIVLVQIPLKTARFSSFFPDLSFICLAAQPLICSTPPQDHRLRSLLNCKSESN